MTAQKIFLHIWRIGLALALLAWFDVRFFFFYAFLLLLVGLHHIDYLRASVRMLSVGHDAKLIAIYERLGVSDDDVLRANARMESRLTPEQLESLANDWKLVS